jgi:hypothetical protein
MGSFQKLYTSLINEFNTDYKDPYADGEEEYKGYTFSYATEYEDDNVYNTYTIFTPSGKEISGTGLQKVGIKLPKDADEAFNMIVALIDGGKI